MVSRLDAGQLYDAHLDFVWRLLSRLGVPSASLEDAVQEVFLVVHRRRAEFRHASSEKTWLGGIAIRVARDFRRTVERKGRTEPLEQGLRIVASSPDPHERAVASQAMALAQRILDGLELEQRTVFVLTELEGLTAAEIAEITGVVASTVSSRLRLARKYFNERTAAHRQQAGVL